MEASIAAGLPGRIDSQAEAEKLDAEFAELTELVSNPDARRKVIDDELVAALDAEVEAVRSFIQP